MKKSINFLEEIAMDLFSNIDLTSKVINANIQRKELINQNLSNVDTPNYKRKDIIFEDLLSEEIEKNGMKVDLDNITPIEYTDLSNSSYRLDGNNVDIEWEKSAETKNELMINTLITRMNAQLGRLKNVLQNLK